MGVLYRQIRRASVKRVETLFAGKEDLLPAPTKLLMAISEFLRTFWYGVIAAIGVWPVLPAGNVAVSRFPSATQGR